jgi:hypothetical protein
MLIAGKSVLRRGKRGGPGCLVTVQPELIGSGPGGHAALPARPGIYAELFALQAEGYISR